VVHILGQNFKYKMDKILPQVQFLLKLQISENYFQHIDRSTHYKTIHVKKNNLLTILKFKMTKIPLQI
jgi:hypothetical protein